jgi:hypothetical protein
VDRDVSSATVLTTKSAPPASPVPTSLLQRPVSPAIAAASLATPLRLTVSPVLRGRVSLAVLVAVAPGIASLVRTLLPARFAGTVLLQRTVSVADVLLLARAATPPISPSALPARMDYIFPGPDASPVARDVSHAATAPPVLPASPDTLPTPTAPASSLASPPASPAWTTSPINASAVLQGPLSLVLPVPVISAAAARRPVLTVVTVSTRSSLAESA